MAIRRDAWWKYARALQQMPETSRRADVPDRATRAHLARIARLPPSIGEALDKQKAPMRVYKYIAYAPNSAAVPFQLGQKARFDAVLAFAAKAERWPLPRQMREIDDVVRARWIGMGSPKRAPTPAATAAQPTTAAPPAVVPSTPAPGASTVQQAAALSPHLAQSLAQAVANQDPEIAAVLRQIAANRLSFGR